MLKRYRPNYDFQVMHCLTEWDTNKQKKTQNIAVYIVRSYDVLSAFVLFFVLNVYVDAHFLRFHNCIPNIVQMTIDRPLRHYKRHEFLFGNAVYYNTYRR